ncbi:MAG: hypothetical protein WAO52_10815 [Prolixibacteraceae bacterium]
MEGGLAHLKEVIVNDSLGIGEKLEADLQKLVETYKCEWKEVVTNPELRKKYRHFVNSEEKDSNIKFVSLREQKMPAK